MRPLVQIITLFALVACSGGYADGEKSLKLEITPPEAEGALALQDLNPVYETPLLPPPLPKVEEKLVRKKEESMEKQQEEQTANPLQEQAKKEWQELEQPES